MSKEKLRVPKLRFPGFTEDWEQRKLGDVGMVKSGVGFPEKEQGGIEGIPFYKVSDMNHFDNQFEMIVANNYVSQNQIKKNRWSPITACSAIIFAKVGAAVLLDRKRLCTNSFMLDNNMMAYIVYPEQLNKYFCKFLFDTINLGNLIQVGALPSLNAKDISDIKKYIPNLSEQNRIAKLLLSVETLITLHQRKLEHLNLKKKALLQKLFPKNGERYPELRFPGFTDAWEQRKLGDIATFSKGNGYSKSDLTPSGSPIILYGRLYTNYETTIKNVDTFVKLKDKSVISQGGEVIVPASGETAEDISRASVVKNQGIILGGDLNVIKVNRLLDPTFLALTISNGEQQKELSKRAQGKSVVHLHNSDLQEVKLTFPLLNEQRAISTLFEKMDNTITLHQRKLEHLQLQKKALLQQMFV